MMTMPRRLRPLPADRATAAPGGPARAADSGLDHHRRRWLRIIGALGLAASGAGLPPSPARAAGDAAGVVLIGHPGLGRLTAAQVVRLYTGRLTELDNQPVSVVNAPAGSPLRQRFLQQFLQQDDAEYRAYWTVRRHIGKGLPPPELPTTADVLRHVAAQPGAIGYIDAADLRPGLNVLLR